jgi:hypothetical protein
MKIKIDENGYLQIARGDGDYISQSCPYTWFASPKCGGWCPLFGEPVHDVCIHHFTGVEIDNGWSLAICQGRVLVGEIIDERGSK